MKKLECAASIKANAVNAFNGDYRTSAKAAARNTLEPHPFGLHAELSSICSAYSASVTQNACNGGYRTSAKADARNTSEPYPSHLYGELWCQGFQNASFIWSQIWSLQHP